MAILEFQKWWGHFGAKEKVGGQRKCLSCMGIFYVDQKNLNGRQNVFNRGLYICAGSWHSENLLKSPLIYSASYLNLEGLSPPVLPRGDGTGLNLPYADIIKIVQKLQ